jgi:hypothetical protein
MSVINLSATRSCIYCGGQATRIHHSEHILPKAIGGALTIKEKSGRVVCHKCNNGILSDLDRELCSRSFLSIIASQQIGGHVWQTWDIDHSSRNLLVEVKPFWNGNELVKLVYYPQMTFDLRTPEIRGDMEDIEIFGWEEFQQVLIKRIRNAFQSFNAGKKRAIYFEQIRSAVALDKYRFPPRIFARHSVFEVAKNRQSSFILRYKTPEDRRFALNCLAQLEDRPQGYKRTWKMGSHYPVLAYFFDLSLTARSLLKLGVNLLAAFCTKTPINSNTFRDVVHLILGDTQLSPTILAANGFVQATDIQDIRSNTGNHSFRIVYLDEQWLIYSSFFGGRIGAVTVFRGPNFEEWNTMDIIAPLGSKEWHTKSSPIIQPIRVHVESTDVSKIMPSIKFCSTNSTLIVENKQNT